MLVRRLSFPSLAVVVLLLLIPACSSPEPNHGSEPAAGQTIPAASPKSAFERDMQFIRNGNFTYVWVFSRQDGKPIDRDDAKFLREKAPQFVDLVITDEGRRVIGGTNFDLEKAGMPELRKRFVVEDYTGK
jgi:hypothetical protein